MIGEEENEKTKYYQACAHTFFDELREPGTKLPSGRELPVLFNFTEQVNYHNTIDLTSSAVKK